MLLTEFTEDYNGAPYTLEDFAQAAAGVSDDKALSEAATAFLQAQRNFEAQLQAKGVELG